MARLHGCDAERSFRVDPLFERFGRRKKMSRGLLIGHCEHHRRVAVRWKAVDQRFPKPVAIGDLETGQTEIEILQNHFARRAGIMRLAQGREQRVGPKIDVVPACRDHGPRGLAKVHQRCTAARGYVGDGVVLLRLEQHQTNRAPSSSQLRPIVLKSRGHRVRCRRFGPKVRPESSRAERIGKEAG